MANDVAKRLIEKLLEHYTPGSILNLLGDVLKVHADEAGGTKPRSGTRSTRTPKQGC